MSNSPCLFAKASVRIIIVVVRLLKRPKSVRRFVIGIAFIRLPLRNQLQDHSSVELLYSSCGLMLHNVLFFRMSRQEPYCT